ncbi:MAG: hypothetical protein LUE86_05315 [Clostridiales bacterium]|nr:hypothetical protein [Clostridiales bacterium]
MSHVTPMPRTALRGMGQIYSEDEAASTSSQTTLNVDAAVTGHMSVGWHVTRNEFSEYKALWGE